MVVMLPMVKGASPLLVRVTVEFGITPPVGSFTVPVRALVPADCPRMDGENRASTVAIKIPTFKTLRCMVFPF